MLRWVVRFGSGGCIDHPIRLLSAFLFRSKGGVFRIAPSEVRAQPQRRCRRLHAEMGTMLRANLIGYDQAARSARWRSARRAKVGLRLIAPKGELAKVARDTKLLDECMLVSRDSDRSKKTMQRPGENICTIEPDYYPD